MTCSPIFAGTDAFAVVHWNPSSRWGRQREHSSKPSVPGGMNSKGARVNLQPHEVRQCSDDKDHVGNPRECATEDLKDFTQ
eukprot:457811-Amphidinium_carterae.1